MAQSKVLSSLWDRKRMKSFAFSSTLHATIRQIKSLMPMMRREWRVEITTHTCRPATIVRMTAVCSTWTKTCARVAKTAYTVRTSSWISTRKTSSLSTQSKRLVLHQSTLSRMKEHTSILVKRGVRAFRIRGRRRPRRLKWSRAWIWTKMMRRSTRRECQAQA